MKSTPSSAHSLDSGRWAEETGTTDALRTLVRGVTRARAFALFFAVCNKPWERDQLMAMLVKALPGTSLHRIEITAQTTDLLAEVCRQALELRGPVMVVGLEQAVRSDITQHEVLAALNLQRPQWPIQVPQPVIFWVPQYVLGFLEREAPDFYDWRSDTIAFPDLAEEDVNHLRDFVWTPAVDGSLNGKARHARLEELRTKLEQTQTSADPFAKRTRASWLRELGSRLAFTGDRERALHSLQQSFELYEALGDKHGLAVTLGDIARIRFTKGELDQAFHLNQERLSIFEDLGDVDGKAKVLRAMSQIEIQQQKWGEALDHLAESYALNLKLGRLDGICHVGLSLGQLRCNAGELEEGLKILARSREGFRQLGQDAMAQQTQALINKILESASTTT